MVKEGTESAKEIEGLAASGAKPTEAPTPSTDSPAGVPPTGEDPVDHACVQEAPTESPFTKAFASPETPTVDVLTEEESTDDLIIDEAPNESAPADEAAIEEAVTGEAPPTEESADKRLKVYRFRIGLPLLYEYRAYSSPPTCTWAWKSLDQLELLMSAVEDDMRELEDALNRLGAPSLQTDGIRLPLREQRAECLLNMANILAATHDGSGAA
ncbi:hypothetical protein BESB_039420 [Besnoitia besnoiti]|uniref:Uncharacterized protein n=1 Tax=Besnoitia besnoiti TaxID=94643 RepID=A0A2A9MJX4_BESBE|nr:hypothetical protein BESB_039420 [Besnoitia besnoiti]PFH37484.1 hypothetical protein BESB_039420 [Besnoitia besnoiti]